MAGSPVLAHIAAAPLIAALRLTSRPQAQLLRQPDPAQLEVHHGMPFCAVTTAVSGPSSGCMSSTTFGTE